MLGVLAGVALAAMGARPAAAEYQTVCDVPSGTNMWIKRYVENSDYASAPALCNGNDQEHFCRLKGFVYVPPGAGPFPALVLNHSGSVFRNLSA
jgi:hypothetical protein